MLKYAVRCLFFPFRFFFLVMMFEIGVGWLCTYIHIYIQYRIVTDFEKNGLCVNPVGRISRLAIYDSQDLSISSIPTRGFKRLSLSTQSAPSSLSIPTIIAIAFRITIRQQ